MKESIELAIRIPNDQPKFHFRMKPIREITAGTEGKKLIGTVASRFGEHGTYFLKRAEADRHKLNSAVSQLEKHQFLRSNGVRVPPFFRHVTTPEGLDYILMTDLSKADRYSVLSLNNHRLPTDGSERMSNTISRQTREHFCMELVRTCMVSADTTPRLSFLPTMFSLVFDPKNPSNSQVVASDIGLDAHFTLEERNWVFLDNLESAFRFYRAMFEEPMRFGHGMQYEALNPYLKDFEDQYQNRHLYAMGALT